MRCDVCGITDDVKKIFHNTKADMNLCNKHNVQFYQYGKFLDNNQQSKKDPNQYRIFNDYIEVDCYDKYGNVNATFIADVEDLDYIKNHKWRTTNKKNKLYVVTGNNRTFPITYFHRLILNYEGELEVDHIDGNSLNNRKSNLRLVNRQQQVNNMKPKNNSKIGIRGISKDLRYNKYVVDFTYDKQRIYLKPFKNIDEAVYARYLLEEKYNSNRYTENDDKIFGYINQLTNYQKSEIEQYIKCKTAEKI